MRKNYKSIQFLIISACLIFSVVFVNGQDLGSSTDLFRPKPKKESTPKKSAPKKTKAAAAKTKSRSSSNTGTANRKTNSNSKTAKNSTRKIKRIDLDTLQNKKPDDDVTITVGEGSDKNSGDSLDEMFEDAITKGNLSRNTRNYTEAEKAYKLAGRIKPGDSRSIYGLGNLYSDQQRWEEAEAAYRRAIELEPENANTYIAISFVLTQPAVGTDLGTRYTEAEEMAKKAIELNPQNPFAYDQLGVAGELQGVISEETEDAYRKAIELEPSFALAYAHLGRLLRVKGSKKKSETAYQKAIELSEDVPTMILVAEVLQSQQRFLESEKLLRNALAIDSKHPTALFFLGRALIIRKSFSEAEEVLKKSVEVSPNSFVSYALLSSVYSKQEIWDKAEQTLNKALRVVSNNEKKRLAQEYESVGDAYMKNKKYSDAKRIYERAVSLDNDKVSLKIKLSEAERNNLSAEK